MHHAERLNRSSANNTWTKKTLPTPTFQSSKRRQFRGVTKSTSIYREPQMRMAL
jgi:hypothetical protein